MFMGIHHCPWKDSDYELLQLATGVEPVSVPWLPSNSQRSACLYLLCARIKGVFHPLHKTVFMP